MKSDKIRFLIALVMIINAIEYCNFFLKAMKDQYANYVVQKMLDCASQEHLALLLAKIKTFTPFLRKYTHGKHLLAKVDKITGGNSASPPSNSQKQHYKNSLNNMPNGMNNQFQNDFYLNNFPPLSIVYNNHHAGTQTTGSSFFQDSMEFQGQKFDSLSKSFAGMDGPTAVSGQIGPKPVTVEEIESSK